MDDEIKFVYLESYKQNKCIKHDARQSDRTSISHTEELPAEKTAILLSDILLIGVYTISVMGVKIGEDISKLEAVLCKQGIKYNYDNSALHPSRLLMIDKNFGFFISENSPCFHLEVLCDDGYKISSFFFRSEEGTDFASLIDSVNLLTDIFSKKKDAKPKKRVMDEVLCVRQDFYTLNNVAKIERGNEFVSLEIMSKQRFEEVVLKWYENNKWKDRFLHILYLLGLLSLPIYNVFVKHQVHIERLLDLWMIMLTFLLYLVCWWFLFTPACWIISSFFWKGEEGKDMRLGCGYPILFVIFMIIGCVLYDKCTHRESVNSLYSTEMSAPPNSTNNIMSRKERQVYICTGPQSKRYHCTRYCRGLESCSDDIELVDVSEAEDVGRSPCRICY